MTAPFQFLKREIPADHGEVDGLCLQLRSLLLEGHLVAQADRFAVELLAREALSNAVRHGCGSDPSRRVTFACRLGHSSVVLTVTDDGDGFDWRRRQELSPDDEATHGRGLQLFQIYASRHFFNSSGNRLLLVRFFPETPMSDYHEATDGKAALLHPGDLTSATVEQVRDRLKILLAAGTRELTIDLAGVQMVDSMGIGLLIQAHNSLAKAGGGLVVKNASNELQDLFRSMRLDKRFTLQA